MQQDYCDSTDMEVADRVQCSGCRCYDSVYPQEPATIHVQDPRPLAKVVRTLEQRYGVVITYEEAPYTHEAQISDVTAAVARSQPKSGRVVGPRGGAFSFTGGVDAGSASARDAIGTRANQFVEEYAGNGLCRCFQRATE